MRESVWPRPGAGVGECAVLVSFIPSIIILCNLFVNYSYFSSVTVFVALSFVVSYYYLRILIKDAQSVEDVA